MEENKNLVVSYRYYAKKNSPELEEVSNRIYEIMSKAPTSESLAMLPDLLKQQSTLLSKEEIVVRKEYPEFVIKGFATKEELLNFIGEDEPRIGTSESISFDNIPSCLEKLGIRNSLLDCEKYKRYILARHSKEGDE